MPHVPVKKKGKRQRRHRRRRFRTTSSSSTASSSSSSTSKRSRLGPPSTSSTFSTSWIKRLPDRLTKDHQRIQVVDDVSDVPEADFATEVVVTDSDEMMAEEAPGAADVPDPPSEDEPAPEPSEPGTSHLEIWQVLQPYKLVTPNCALCPDRHQWPSHWVDLTTGQSLPGSEWFPSDTVLGPSVLGLADHDGGDHVGQWHAPSAAMQPSLQPTLQPVAVQAASRPVMLQAAQPLCLQPPVTRVKPVRMQLPMAGVGRRVNHIPAQKQHLIAGAAAPPPPPPAPPPAHGNAVRPRPHAKPKPGTIVKMNVWFKNGVLRTFLQGHSR